MLCSPDANSVQSDPVAAPCSHPHPGLSAAPFPLPTEVFPMGFLQGKRALIVGIASNRSIAYGV
ncbi:MAG: hypothetical protein MUF57_09215, partial [Gammaproteobacteria bacterium]|nr:hypothetical protein [Gammaproteobacteria bacterium]